MIPFKTFKLDNRGKKYIREKAAFYVGATTFSLGNKSNIFDFNNLELENKRSIYISQIIEELKKRNLFNLIDYFMMFPSRIPLIHRKCTNYSYNGRARGDRIFQLNDNFFIITVFPNSNGTSSFVVSPSNAVTINRTSTYFDFKFKNVNSVSNILISSVGAASLTQWACFAYSSNTPDVGKYLQVRGDTGSAGIGESSDGTILDLNNLTATKLRAANLSLNFPLTIFGRIDPTINANLNTANILNDENFGFLYGRPAMCRHGLVTKLISPYFI